MRAAFFNTRAASPWGAPTGSLLRYQIRSPGPIGSAYAVRKPPLSRPPSIANASFDPDGQAVISAPRHATVISGPPAAPFTPKPAASRSGARSISNATATPVPSIRPPALHPSRPRQRAQNPSREADSAASKMRWRCFAPSFPRESR
jgi:hypothetical protein